MKTTFCLQRKHINSTPAPSFQDLRIQWPYLFTQRGIYCHFELLTDISMLRALELSIAECGQGIEKYLRTKAKTKDVQSVAPHSEDGELCLHVIQLLMAYFDERTEGLILFADMFASAADVERTLTLLASPRLIVLVAGDEVTIGRWIISIESHVICEGIPPSVITDLAAVFATYYVFNLQYQEEAARTLEFVQSMIRISRNGWHTLLNFLFHMGLTFGVFAGGINQINLPFVCQTVGIVLHYASLSTMLWLTFTARNICKDVSKDQLQTRDSNRSAQIRTKPTILRFYLVSDGIPLIIVGVTAAFGMDNYGSRDDALYCWMAWEPSLGGFFAPMSLLVVVMSVYFLCTYIQLKRHPERKYELQVLSEEQQQLSFSESNDHCHSNNGGASGPSGDCPPFATGVSVLGNEHSFKSQLRATAFTLFLFLATWALGALAVSLGHFLDMIFSCLYGAFCVTLGLFLLIQHCAKRDDVWHHWWACCMSKPKTEDGNGHGQSQRLEFHQPHCHLSSPCSGKQPLLSPHLVQSSYHKMTPPPQSPTSSHPGPFCVAMMGPVTQTSISSLAEPVPSLCSLSDELPHSTLPLQSCLNNRTKSRSFNRPRPCLQDYLSYMTSTSMGWSVDSSHLNSSHAVQHQEGSTLVSNSPNPDIQFPCISPQLDKQLASCHSLQRQTSCHSVQDSMASCHRHTHNMHDSITSFHSLLLPSHGVHTCQWHMYSSADHSSTTSCCEKPNPFTLQYQQDPDTYSCLLKKADREKDNVCVEVGQQDFPRNTLPRQHGTVSWRGTIGRNRSLQEDGLLGSDATGNIRTGPWKNETTV